MVPLSILYQYVESRMQTENRIAFQRYSRDIGFRRGEELALDRGFGVLCYKHAWRVIMTKVCQGVFNVVNEHRIDTPVAITMHHLNRNLVHKLS